MTTLMKFLEETRTLDTVLSGLDRIAERTNPAVDSSEILTKLEEFHVVFNGRTVRRAGGYSHDRKYIELHSTLMVEGREEHRNSTLLHEVAHAITVAIFGQRPSPHGREWKFVMTMLGRPTKRTHSYDFLSEGKLPNLIYACQKCEHEIPAQRRKKYPPENYYHTACGHAGKLYLKRNNKTRQFFANPSA